MSSSYLPYSRNHSSLVPWSNWVTCENIIFLGTGVETANLFTCTVIYTSQDCSLLSNLYGASIHNGMYRGSSSFVPRPLVLIAVEKKFSILELRLSVPDFVSHLIFFQSCKTKSRTESLGSRLISLHSREIKSWSDLRTRLGQQSIIPTHLL